MTKAARELQDDLFPPDWELLTLEEIVDPNRTIRYGIVQPGKYDYQGRFLIRGQDYSRGWVSQDKFFRVSDQVEARFKNARVKENDLIITIVGAGTGNIESIPKWLDGANLTQTTARISVDPAKVNWRFCKFVLQSPFLKNQITSYIKGAAQPGLNCGDIKKFVVPLPKNILEQERIARIISEIDDEIDLLEKMLDKKRNLRVAIAQDILMRKANWISKPFGEIAKLYQLKTVGQNRFTSYGFPVYGANGFVGFYDAFNIETWKTLIACRGTCGIVNKAPDRSWVNGNAMVVDVDSNAEVDKGFFHFLIQNTDFREAITGSGIPQITRTSLQDIDIAIPDNLEEQKAIAGILSSLDNELEILQRKVTKRGLVREGIVHELISGKVRIS
jgi:type I restriction enzyme S subunit